jgi:hypothetical protein
VFATSPTLVTPALGTPASGTLTNCTGLPTAGLVDDAVSLAKMASGTAGNLITYDASGNPAAVATGTSGQVLTSNGAGAAPTFQAAAGGSGGGGYGVLLDTQTASASSQLSFDDFDSTYEKYIIEWDKIVPTVDGDVVGVGWRSAGSNALTGTTHSCGITYYGPGSGASIGQIGHTATGYYPLDYNGANFIGNASNEGCGFVVELHPRVTTAERVILYHGYYTNQSSQTYTVPSAAGLVISSTVMDGVFVKFASGTIASGTVRLWGVPKS